MGGGDAADSGCDGECRKGGLGACGQHERHGGDALFVGVGEKADGAEKAGVRSEVVRRREMKKMMEKEQADATATMLCVEKVQPRFEPCSEVKLKEIGSKRK